MPITDWIEKLGRAVFESPFGAVEPARDTPELAEIRLALLDEVKARSHRAGGRSVFPYNLVRIRIFGVPDSQAKLFTGRFFSDFCQGELRAGLTRSNYRFPDELEVQVETTPQLPGSKEGWLVVETTTKAAPPAPAIPRRTAKLVVIKGKANVAELALSKARTNIGRTVDVFRADGPSRRNDLAFADSDELSKTVSREHAHITYSKKTGEYRLFNDRSYAAGATAGTSCGLWIIRDGLSHEIHRDVRGVKLEPGDEISFGRGLVRFVR